MSEGFFHEIKNELQNGVKVKGHPFRFFTLATTGVDNYARLRTMALRKVSKNLKLTFFTDGRSKKIIHIKENKRVSLLFYHPEKLLQLRVQGIATRQTNVEKTKKIWNELGSESKKVTLQKMLREVRFRVRLLWNTLGMGIIFPLWKSTHIESNT